MAHIPIVGDVKLVLNEMLALLAEIDKCIDEHALNDWWQQSMNGVNAMVFAMMQMI